MKGTIEKHCIIQRDNPLTGKAVYQLTSCSGNHHHLYFTSNSFTKDNKHIIFISEGNSGSPNLFRLNLEDGEAVQLTENTNGYLKSYVYYDGEKEKGLGKASVSFSPETNRLLYIDGRDIKLLNVASLEETTVYELPPKVMTGFTHISRDGRYACIPYISDSAFQVQGDNPFSLIRQKVENESIQSHVLVIDTQTGQSNIWFSHVGWITHVQFHPYDQKKILFNHEGGEVDQRIWLYDNGEIKKVRDESIENHFIWICHEVWSNDGEYILFHGRKQLPDLEKEEINPSLQFIGRSQLKHSEQAIELTFPPQMDAYGHFTLSPNDHWLVTDGIINPNMIHICQAHWDNKQLKWFPLCEHGSSFLVQDVHPHPIFSHDGRYVLYTSDVHNEKGQGNVYLVEV
ncbi:Tol biopolymer transport system component [Pullulanibacillus pueri]|uniref:Oligogalacturonide lyase n=1 Tax=Pullulanibacillus pueri TaxID=1437324 RepID=A0A8J2ZZ16_9BACL|nr:oligogalacturonate lyase family protein [Pullulanibacillus pueri]MBM7682982.1 Tol biopolymer transport system component [Pullulanibacillus pueri]GGH85961.1 oligogalacturonide lyase [Pullulanibacillus pueri]